MLEDGGGNRRGGWRCRCGRRREVRTGVGDGKKCWEEGGKDKRGWRELRDMRGRMEGRIYMKYRRRKERKCGR